MFVDRLLNSGNAPILEQMVRFTEARHRLIAENQTNISTPNYRQKDLDTKKFQATLLDRVRNREKSGPQSPEDLAKRFETPDRDILFHDRNNRSVEQIQSDMAQNGMMHNLMVELLRKQFSSIQDALREKVG